MTDKDIINALECCLKQRTCDGCPLVDKYANGACRYEAKENALALINRQQAEIERLENDLKIWKDIAHRETSYVKTAKAEAVKEFAERLKANESEICCWCNHSNNGRRTDWCDEDINGHCRCLGFSKFESKIDNLVKEMIGE